MPGRFNIIVIGGSAGSLPVITKLITGLPDGLKVPVVIVVHRQKNVLSEMPGILAMHSKGKKIVEPEDKQPIENSVIYLAPQNYHLLIEADQTFSLDYSELVQYSRPSIDVTFESAALAYNMGCLGILLSGSNTDGTNGIQAILQRGGSVIVQDPSEADFSMMPASALLANPLAQNLSPEKIVTFIANSAC